jgi:hypothetical protein
VAREAAEPVYNLEVQGVHVYHVTASGLLVHNPIACRTTPWGTQGPNTEIHHIVTRFANLGRKWAKNWARMSANLLKNAGLSVESFSNKVHLPNHFGQHTELYHRRIYERLRNAVRDATTRAERREAILEELERIANDLLADPARLSGVGL